MPSAKLEIEPLVEGEAQAEVGVNEAIARLEGVTQLILKGINVTTPPGSPTEGDAYHIGASATGVWNGKDGLIAVYNAGWMFYTPTEGWMAVLITGTRGIYVWDAADPVLWVAAP